MRFLSILDFDGWFSPLCIYSEAPLDLSLLNVYGVSVGLLQSGLRPD